MMNPVLWLQMTNMISYQGLVRTFLNNWLSEEESLWIQSRIHLRALRYYSNWRQYFAGYTFGRQYRQSPEDDHL
ncbi:DUF1266 domain-containing protein, partial [Acinetobacter baumannii]